MDLVGGRSGVMRDMADAYEDGSQEHNKAAESLTISRILGDEAVATLDMFCVGVESRKKVVEE